MGKSHIGALDVAGLAAAAVGLYFIAKILRPTGSAGSSPSLVTTPQPSTGQGSPTWNIIGDWNAPRIPLIDPRTDAPVVVSPGFGNPVLAPFFPVPIAPEAWNPLNSSFPHAQPGGLPDWLEEGFYRVTHPFWWTEGAN